MDILQLDAQQPISLETPRQFRHALEPVVNESVTDVKIRQKIMLCISEAVTNLVVHARPSVQQMSICFGRDDASWYLDIFDDSDAWAPAQKLDDNLLLNFKEIEDGRGIALLHSQCDKLTYESAAQQPNQLRLRWSFPQQQKHQTILIVEDNNSLRLLYQAYLAKDFTVLTASNGFQALDKLAANHIDLVLSDIRMPEMNGLSLRKKIQQQTGCELIPFIFLTAEDDQMVQQQAMQLGIDDYLIKPINKPQLLSIIQRVLGRSKQVFERLTERIDKKITASLKPQLPATENGWHFQVANRDTGSGGGDLLLHKNFTTMTQLLLTDIMGHDDSAKFFSHAYSGYAHGLMQAMPTQQNAGQLLKQISNFALHDKLLSQITFTCCSIQLAQQGKITIASAGHPAPLLISAQQIQTVETSGVLPGLVPDPQYKNTTLHIKKGQRLAFYTDGLFESAHDNNARSKLQEQINEVLLGTLNLPIEESLKKVMTTFDHVTKGQPNDDVLLLLIEPIT